MNDEEINLMWKEFTNLLVSTKREGIDNIIDWLNKTDFKIAPASTRYHDSFKGGLLKHSLNVYYEMIDDFKNFIEFFNIPKDSVIIMSLLHDVCKVQFYKTELRNTKNENGEWIKVPYYTVDEIRPYGHGDKSVIELLRNGLKLTDIEIACIRNHMGFSPSEDANRVTALFNKCPQALVLHWADCASTFIEGSLDLQDKFRNKLLGRSINESLKILSEDYIDVNNVLYKKVKDNDIISNETIITIKDNNGNDIKVYSNKKLN